MPAAYSVDLREKVIKYLEQNNSKKSASKLFNIGESTIQRWISQYKKQGHIKPRKRLYAFRRIDPEELKKFLDENPDLFLFEIAQHFSVTLQAIFYACKRLKITRKKRPRSTLKEIH
jgi:transposase